MRARRREGMGMSDAKGGMATGGRIVGVLAVGIVLLAAAPMPSVADEKASSADETAPDTEQTVQKASTWKEGFLTRKPPTWQFEAEPYAWLFGQYGSADVKGHTVDFAVSPTDAYGLLEDGNAF